MKNFSNRWMLSLSDWQKGFLIAVAGAALSIIYPILWAWLDEPGWIMPEIDWKLVLKSAFNAATAYLGINTIMGQPKSIMIDPAKTSVLDKDKKPIVDHMKVSATIIDTDIPPGDIVEEGHTGPKNVDNG